jgi:hypothetical protein
MKIEALEWRKEGGKKWKNFERGGDAELLFFFSLLRYARVMGIGAPTSPALF